MTGEAVISWPLFQGDVDGLGNASNSSRPPAPAGIDSMRSSVFGVAADSWSPHIDIVAGPTVCSANVG